MHDDWFSLVELNGRLGGLLWVEQMLADVLTAWAVLEPDPGASVLFATSSRHHQWHATVLRDCLATSPPLADDDPVRPPQAGWEQAEELLRSLDSIESTGARLRVLHRTIGPWLEREIGALTELANPVSDAATMRWLRFVSLDHADAKAKRAVLLALRTDDAARFRDYHVLQRVTEAVQSPPVSPD